MNILILINDSPYGTERAFNALRLARALQMEHPAAHVRIFLLSDGVTCSLPNQIRPEGSSNIEQLLKDAVGAGAEIKACITCIDHRGLFGLPLVEGIEHGNMANLAEWVVEADRVLNF